jgi:hypothetical protein
MYLLKIPVGSMDLFGARAVSQHQQGHFTDVAQVDSEVENTPRKVHNMTSTMLLKL